MTVKIEMEMPKRCERCKFNIKQRCYAGDFVLIMPEAFINRRHSKCPLQEVKE